MEAVAGRAVAERPRAPRFDRLPKARVHHVMQPTSFRGMALRDCGRPLIFRCSRVATRLSLPLMEVRGMSLAPQPKNQPVESVAEDWNVQILAGLPAEVPA